MYKLYTFFVGCNALVLPLQHFTFVLNQILNQIVLTTMKRMLNRMLRYADAIVKRGVDKLIDAIGQAPEPQTQNTETHQPQKRMDNDTDCPTQTTESDDVRRMWCSMRFAANAENIRTKGHKNRRYNVCVSCLARKT